MLSLVAVGPSALPARLVWIDLASGQIEVVAQDGTYDVTSVITAHVTN